MNEVPILIDLLRSIILRNENVYFIHPSMKMAVRAVSFAYNILPDHPSTKNFVKCKSGRSEIGITSDSRLFEIFFVMASSTLPLLSSKNFEHIYSHIDFSGELSNWSLEKKAFAWTLKLND